MPKKIFNSDLETSGALKATSVIADTATISGGYIAASTLTDGTATLSGGVLTANTLTDGTATLSGGVLTANTLTDGTATLSGGTLLAQNIQASNEVSASVIRSNSNSLRVINSHGDSDGGSNSTPFVMRLVRPADASGAVEIIETNEDDGSVNGVRLSYQGDNYESLGVANPNTTNNVSAIQAVNKQDFVNPERVHNILSFDSTGNGVRLESADDITLVPAQDNGQVYIKRDSAANGPIGLTIRKPVNGSAYLSVVEGVGNLYGGRLAYEGDDYVNSEGVQLESLGVGIADTVALQALSAGTVNNVLTYRYTGENVTLNSVDNLTLKQEIGGFLRLGNEYDLDSDIRLHGLPNSNTGIVSYNLVWKPGDNGRVYYDTDNILFSAGHLYKSDTILPVGTAVELSDNKVQASSSSMSKVVVGIVARQEEFTEDFQVTTSLGENHTSGFATKVIALGDTRMMDCPGFNVCNENGDIQPGDLLVTSSTPGYLMKQDDDIIRSKTVGKAMEAVTFDANGQATGIYGYIYCG